MNNLIASTLSGKGDNNEEDTNDDDKMGSLIKDALISEKNEDEVDKNEEKDSETLSEVTKKDNNENYSQKADENQEIKTDEKENNENKEENAAKNDQETVESNDKNREPENVKNESELSDKNKDGQKETESEKAEASEAIIDTENQKSDEKNENEIKENEIQQKTEETTKSEEETKNEAKEEEIKQKDENETKESEEIKKESQIFEEKATEEPNKTEENQKETAEDENKVTFEESDKQNTESQNSAEDQNNSQTKPQNEQKKSTRNTIPPNLKPYVKEGPDTLVYRALTGNVPIGVTANERQNLQKDLTRYVNICIENDLIGEAVYVQGIANEVRNDRTVCKESIQGDYNELQEKINYQRECLENQNATYDKQIEEYDREAQEKMAALENNYQQALDNLDKEWSSPEKEQLYTKPSADLLNLRHMLKKMVKSKQLDNIETITTQIEAKEKEESKMMEKQMEIDYEHANNRLDALFNTERTSILGIREKKINNVLCEKEKNARKFEAKIENLEREKENFISKYRNSGLDTRENKKGKATSRDVGSATTRPTVRNFNEQKLPDFVEKAKLPPPVFKPKKRVRMSPLYSTQPNIKKPTTSRSQTRSRLYSGI